MKKEILTKEQSDIVQALIRLVFKDKTADEQSQLTIKSQQYNEQFNGDDLYCYVCSFWINLIPEQYVNLIPQNIEPEILALRKNKEVSYVEPKFQAIENKKIKSNRSGYNKSNNNIVDNNINSTKTNTDSTES